MGLSYLSFCTLKTLFMPHHHWSYYPVGQQSGQRFFTLVLEISDKILAESILTIFFYGQSPHRVHIKRVQQA